MQLLGALTFYSQAHAHEDTMNEGFDRKPDRKRRPKKHARKRRACTEQGDSVPTQADLMLTADDVARVIGLSVRTVRLFAEAQVIPGAHIDNDWRFNASDID